MHSLFQLTAMQNSIFEAVGSPRSRLILAGLDDPKSGLR
jgi:hypothetical protein